MKTLPGAAAVVMILISWACSSVSSPSQAPVDSGTRRSQTPMDSGTSTSQAPTQTGARLAPESPLTIRDLPSRYYESILATDGYPVELLESREWFQDEFLESGEFRLIEATIGLQAFNDQLASFVREILEDDLFENSSLVGSRFEVPLLRVYDTTVDPAWLLQLVAEEFARVEELWGPWPELHLMVAAGSRPEYDTAGKTSLAIPLVFVNTFRPDEIGSTLQHELQHQVLSGPMGLWVSEGLNDLFATHFRGRSPCSSGYNATYAELVADRALSTVDASVTDPGSPEYVAVASAGCLFFEDILELTGDKPFLAMARDFQEVQICLAGREVINRGVIELLIRYSPERLTDEIRAMHSERIGEVPNELELVGECLEPILGPPPG